jgi:hypothetical protein
MNLCPMKGRSLMSSVLRFGMLDLEWLFMLLRIMESMKSLYKAPKRDLGKKET